MPELTWDQFQTQLDSGVALGFVADMRRNLQRFLKSTHSSADMQKASDTLFDLDASLVAANAAVGMPKETQVLKLQEGGFRNIAPVLGYDDRPAKGAYYNGATLDSQIEKNPLLKDALGMDTDSRPAPDAPSDPSDGNTNKHKNSLTLGFNSSRGQLKEELKNQFKAKMELQLNERKVFNPKPGTP